MLRSRVYAQGQVVVRINRTRTEWPTATNPPTVREYTVRLEQIVNSKAQLVTTATVAAANAGRDVVFGGLQAGRYRVSRSVDMACTGCSIGKLWRSGFEECC